MNILLVHQYFLKKNDGGGSRFNELSELWAKEGHQTIVLAGMVQYTTGEKPVEYKGRWVCKELYSTGVTVYRCYVSEAYNINYIGRLWAYISFVASSIWAGVCRVKTKPDIILVTSPPLFVGLTGYVLSRIIGIPLVFEIRDLWPESAIDTGVLSNRWLIRFSYAFEKWIYRKSKKINVLTPAFRKVLETRKRISPDKIFMVPNAADFRMVENLEDSFDRESFRKEKGFDGYVVIVYVGAHGVANNLMQLVDAACLLIEENIQIVSIGAGMQKAELIKAAEGRNLKNIRFLDPVPKKEVFHYILAADIGTSVLMKNETFKTVYSNKTFDYMSCKKPILMAIDGVSRELVENAQCGRYVTPEDPESFARQARYYLNHPEQMTIDGENGYHYAKKWFDRNLLAKKYLEKLKGVSSG